MDDYWDKMVYHTPYFYTSIILRPDHGLGWLEMHWHGYDASVKEVGKGIEKFEIAFGRRLVEKGGPAAME